MVCSKCFQKWYALDFMAHILVYSKCTVSDVMILKVYTGFINGSCEHSVNSNLNNGKKRILFFKITLHLPRPRPLLVGGYISTFLIFFQKPLLPHYRITLLNPISWNMNETNTQQKPADRSTPGTWRLRILQVDSNREPPALWHDVLSTWTTTAFSK